MALSTTNSLVTADEAEAYFEDRAHSVWEDTDETPTDALLISATTALDLQPWLGEKADEDQELSWPRSGCYYR